jgi:pyruvate kinase
VFTPDPKVYQQLALSFGCYPMVVEEEFTSVNEAIERSEREIKEAGLVNEGDKIVIVAGVPFGRSGNTNLLIVETI